MEQQMGFSFGEKKNFPAGSQRENSQCQLWNIPVGNADRSGEREEASIEYDGEIWKLNGEECSLDEIEEKLGGTWKSAVNKSESLTEAVRKSKYYQ